MGDLNCVLSSDASANWLKLTRIEAALPASRTWLMPPPEIRAATITATKAGEAAVAIALRALRDVMAQAWPAP